MSGIKNNSVGSLYKYSFDNSPTPTWIEDFTELYAYLQLLKKRRIKNIRTYLDRRPEVVKECAEKIVVVDVNQAAVLLHKAKNKKDLLTFIDNTFTEKSYETFKEEIIAIYNNKRFFEDESELKTLSGDVLDVIIQCKLKLKKNKIHINASAIVTIVDISKQKKYQKIINASTAVAISWAAKPTAREIFVSENIKSVLGYSANDFLSGKISYKEIVYRKDLGRVKDEARYYCSFKEVKNYTHKPYRVITKDKKIKWVEDRTTIRRSGSGEVISYDGIIVDITDRVLADKKSKTAEQIINSSPVVAFVWKNEKGWPVEFVSENVKNLFGYSAQEFLEGKAPSYYFLVHPEDLKRISNEAKTFSKDKSVNYFEHKPYRIITKKKEIKYVEDRTFINRDENGNIISFQGLLLDVTDRIITQNKLRDEENKFRRLVEKSLVGVYIIQDGKFPYVNPKLAEVFGYKQNEIIDKLKVSDLVVPQDRKIVSENVRKRIKGKAKSIHYSFKGLRKDKTVIDVEVYGASAVYNNKPAVIGTLIDITERKQKEIQLIRTKNRLRSILDASDQAIFTKDLKGNLIEVNKAFSDIFGKTPEELVGKNDYNLLGKENSKKVIKYDKAVIKLKKNIISEDEFTFKGKHLIVRTSRVPLKDEKGKIIGITGFAEDITIQKQAEREIKEREKHYRDLFSLSSTGIVIVDSKMKIYDLNEAFCKSTGYSKEELLGKDIGFLAKPKRKAEVKKHFNRIIKGEILDHEVVNVRKDGTERIVRLHERSFKFPDGSVGVLSVGEDITEQKLYEKTLIESEEKFRSLTENTNSGIFIIQGERFIYVNRAIRKMTGYKFEELTNLNFWDIVHPDFKEVIKQRALLRQIGKNVTKKYEFKLVTKQGKELWIDFSATLIKYKGKPAILGTGFDITKRKLIEISLKESEEKFRSLTESANSGIFIVSGEQLVYVNPAFKEISGFSSEDVKNMKFWDFVHPDYKQLIKERGFARLNGKKVPQRYEFKIITKQGKEKWLDFSATRIKFMGRPAILGTTFDITNRKLTEVKLTEQYIKNEKILATALDGFILTDTDGKICDVNNSYCKMMKYTREELLGMNIKQIYGYLSPDEINQKIRNFMRRGQDRFETVHLNKNGEYVDVEASLSLMVFEGKKYIGAFVRDIGDRKKYEEEILENQRQLRELALHLQSVREEERKLLARELHDELGQILTAAKIDLKLLEKTSKENGNEIKEITHLVQEGLTATKKLVTQLRPEMLQTLGFIDSIKEMLLKINKNKQLKTYFRSDVKYIYLDFDKSLPLYRIVQESLTNIIKHSKSKVANVQIKTKEKELTIIIKDSGVGFDPRHIKSGCFGLLGMKERLIPLNGDVKIKSKIGAGTTVTVKVPYSAE